MPSKEFYFLGISVHSDKIKANTIWVLKCTRGVEMNLKINQTLCSTTKDQFLPAKVCLSPQYCILRIEGTERMRFSNHNKKEKDTQNRGLKSLVAMDTIRLWFDFWSLTFNFGTISWTTFWQRPISPKLMHLIPHRQSRVSGHRHFPKLFDWVDCLRIDQLVDGHLCWYQNVIR